MTHLYERGKRLSPYAIRTQTPAVGWLHYDLQVHAQYEREKVTARLVNDAGDDLIAPLDFARLVACRGRTGALIEGVEHRRKGTKHSIEAAQRWWAEAPPRTRPLLDPEARVLAAERAYAARKIAGWGDV